MGLHTEYLGRVVVTPTLSDDEVDYLKAFSRTRHWDHPDGPFRISRHPTEDDRGDARDADAINRPAPGCPELWCPWTPCSKGCCIRWDGAEKPYQPVLWLHWLIDNILGPQPEVLGTPEAERWGLAGDHLLNGMLVGERRETGELFAIVVKDNLIRRRVLVPGAQGVDEWGYDPPLSEHRRRVDELEARQRRYARALVEDGAA